MKALRSRNQAAVGAVTVVVLVLGVLTTYYSDSLPLLSNSTTYSAYFAESAGLSPDNDVQVAGVRVGEVTSVELKGDKVLVDFTVEDTRVGPASTAAVGIKTLLGEKYLELQPAGDGQLDPSDPIPLSRTKTPYQLQEVFDKLSGTVRDIDTDQLSNSFKVLTNALEGAPEHLRTAVNGLSDLSETISSRDKQLGKLLSNTSEVSDILAQRNDRISKVIKDGNLLLNELQQRRAAIDKLLQGTQDLADELSGLVAENQQKLQPALQKLGELTKILENNKGNLSRSLKLLGPFVRVGANAIGNGQWFEGYFCGLLPPSYLSEPLTVNPQGCEQPLAAPNQGVYGGDN